MNIGRLGAALFARGHCPTGYGYTKHYMTVYGHPGVRAPVCQRCGAHRTRRPLTEDEMLAYKLALPGRPVPDCYGNYPGRRH